MGRRVCEMLIHQRDLDVDDYTLYGVITNSNSNIYSDFCNLSQVLSNSQQYSQGSNDSIYI